MKLGMCYMPTYFAAIVKVTIHSVTRRNLREFFILFFINLNLVKYLLLPYKYIY